MAARLYALTVLASDPDALGLFWRDLLAESARCRSIPLVFKQADLPRSGLNQMHFHLTSYTATQEANVERALSLGATHLDVGQLPDEDHVVLADPDGNEFCVIESTNNWLAGTGFLGEVAADGTREVGVFWAAALDWPLFHDEDGETAIQPPEGRIIIAWGGPPLNERARAEPDALRAATSTTSTRRLSGWWDWGPRRSRAPLAGRDGGPGRQRVLAAHDPAVISGCGTARRPAGHRRDASPGRASRRPGRRRPR